MTATTLIDAAGRRRSPATLPGYNAGSAPANKGRRYPADPPRVEEIISVMREAGDGPVGVRMRALIAVLWRACGSRRRLSSPRRTSSRATARFWSAAARAASDARWAWTIGDGST